MNAYTRLLLICDPLLRDSAAMARAKALALAGGGVLLGLAIAAHSVSKVVGVSIYAAGLVAMLAFSTAYNYAKAQYRPLLRRLDHAGIFLAIAGRSPKRAMELMMRPPTVPPE